ISFDTSECQLSVGPGGLRLFPPINLVTVFRKENIDELLEEEKWILSELKTRVNISCIENDIECKNITLLNYLEKTNETLTEEEREAAIKLTESSSLDFPVTELLEASLSMEEENQNNTTQYSDLVKEPKTPSFLPLPFSSGGWIVSYIILNSVMLGLYVLLAWPYFLTGRTVERVIHTVDEGLKLNQTDQESEPYMGYTTYGDSDMLMTYMMSNGDDDDNDTNDQNEEESGDDSGASASGEGGSTNNDDLDESSGDASGSGKEDMEGSSSGMEETSENDQEKVEEEEPDDDTRCIENIMCLRPVFGARALSSANLALKILEWIPGNKKTKLSTY
ncbi:hypothetical protein Avbf_05837, partial [Armadillidium vulgare]